MTTIQTNPQTRMSLAAITKGPVRAPSRIVIYGTEGIGKSTWASHAASVIWLPVEEGANALDVQRFPKVTTWGDLVTAIDTLTNDEHSFKTLVIDTLDALEPIVWARTVATRLNGDKRVNSIEDYGFAKGYIYALDYWGEVLQRLDTLRDKRGLDIILVAHAALVTIKSPDTEDWQRYDLKLHQKASAKVREWADHCLFATNQLGMSKLNQRMKVTSMGERVLHTVSAAGWAAKTRSNAPAELPLSYEAWVEATATPEGRDAILARLEVALLSVPEAKHAKVREAIAAALSGTDPVGRLRAVENKLAMTINKEAA
jgi:hypothetical protein